MGDTDMSRRIMSMHEDLRRGLDESDMRAIKNLLVDAAKEIDRYYNGMANWKANAQAKDKTIADLRAQLAAAPVAAQSSCRYPLCQSEAEQTKIADEVYRELYSGEPAPVAQESKPITIKELVRSVKAGEKWKIDEPAPVAAQSDDDVTPLSKKELLWNIKLLRDEIDAMEAAPVAAQEPAGWRDFLVNASQTAGLMVNGNHLSMLAKRLLDATPPQGERQPECAYCTSPNKGVREAYFDQNCAGCVLRMK